MNIDKRKRLEAHGWKVGSAEEFLGLSNEEIVEVNKRLGMSIDNVRKLRLFEYTSGKAVWVLDLSGLISNPYNKPFHEKDGYRVSTSFNISREFEKSLKKSLPFKKEITSGGCIYYWYESYDTTVAELAKLVEASRANIS